MTCNCQSAGYAKVEGDVTFNPSGKPSYFSGDAKIVEERTIHEDECPEATK